MQFWVVAQYHCKKKFPVQIWTGALLGGVFLVDFSSIPVLCGFSVVSLASLHIPAQSMSDWLVYTTFTLGLSVSMHGWLTHMSLCETLSNMYPTSCSIITDVDWTELHSCEENETVIKLDGGKLFCHSYKHSHHYSIWK